MRILKVALIASSLLAAPAFVSASTHLLSLKEALQYALENSPVFDTARKTQSVRELEYKTAVAKLLPSLDLTTTTGLQNTLPIASTAAGNASVSARASSPWYSSINLALNETLYDNGVSITQLGIADLNRDLAAVEYAKARDSLVLDVAAEFYRFSLAKILLEVKQQQQSILTKQFNNLTNQYRQGFKTKSDYLRFKTQVQRAEIDRITAENNIAQSESNLHKLLGVAYRSPETPSFDPIRVDRDRKADGFLPSNPPLLEEFFDYRITKIQQAINDKNVTLTKRNYWPQLSVTSGVGYLNQDFINSPYPFPANQQLAWNVGLTIQYNLFDWGSRKRDVQIAEYNRDIQENGLNENLLDVRAQTAALMADISRVSKNYGLTHELLDLEEESTHDLELQYREGKVTYLDLITELNNLLDAKVQFCTAYFDALTDLAKYQYYEGKLYDSLVGK